MPSDLADELAAIELPSEDEPSIAPENVATPDAPADETEGSGEPEGEGGTDETPGDDAGEGSVDASKAIVSWMDESYGTRYGEKYANDAEFLRGLHNAAEKIGQRDAEAEWARQYRPLIEGREEQLRALLTGQQQPAPQQQPAAITRDRFQLLQSKKEAGVLSPEEARELSDAASRIQAAIMDLAFAPEKVFEPVAQKVSQQAQQAAAQLAQQQMAVSQQTAVFNDYEDRNRSWLYDANGSPTPAGKAFVGYMQHGKSVGISDPAELISYGQAMLAANAPKQQPTAKASAHAKRKPQVASPAKPLSSDERGKLLSLSDDLMMAFSKLEAEGGNLG